MGAAELVPDAAERRRRLGRGRQQRGVPCKVVRKGIVGAPALAAFLRGPRPAGLAAALQGFERGR